MGIKYNTVVQTLQAGQKITLCFMGEFGGISTIQTEYIKSENSSHYLNAPEDKDGVKIHHKPKRKRQAYTTNISYITPVVVYDGWIDVDTDSIVYETVSNDGGMTIKTSRYAMHDSRLFTDLIQKYPNTILQCL